MNSTQVLHHGAPSLRLDNVTRALLTSGTLTRYMNASAVTGLTSNPTIFAHAIREGDDYDAAIRHKALAGKSGKALFFELALEDLLQAAELYRRVPHASDGVDGRVSLEVSPLLADDIAVTIKAAVQVHPRAQRPNLFIEVPGTPAGLPAVEETILADVPENVTLPLSREHDFAAAAAYMHGIGRRLAAGRDQQVACVESIFINPWDVTIKDKVNDTLRSRLGIAIAMRTHKPYRNLLTTSRWRKPGGCRWPAATRAVGKHRQQRPRRVRHSICRVTRGAGYG